MLRSVLVRSPQALSAFEAGHKVPTRGYKRVKISPEAIKKAQEAKAAQLKETLEKYYANVPEEAADKKKIDERQEMVKEMAKTKAASRRNMRKIKTKGNDVSYEPWRDQVIEETRNRTAYANDPALSERMKRKAYSLHCSAPHYWTPIRLASLFKTSPIRMRSVLYSAKIETEAKAAGVEMDDVIEDGMAEIFGEVDFLGDFDGKAPAEIPIRKTHNPWYYINPALKGAELLKFVRSRESKYYRESSRIPAQRVEPVVSFKEHLASGLMPRPEPTPNKKPYHIMVDTSAPKNLYNREVVVREASGHWRTGTWEERRRVHDQRRHLKFPYTIPFAWPDETQADGIPVSAKPPPSFEVQYEGEDDLTYDKSIKYDWESMYKSTVPPPYEELNRLKKIAAKEAKAAKAAAAAPAEQAADA